MVKFLPMKHLLILFITALSLVLNLKAQEAKDYAIINVFITNTNWASTGYKFLIEFNTSDIIKIANKEVLEYKMYSEGPVLVGIDGNLYTQIEVKNDSVYYIGVNFIKGEGWKIELQEKIMLNETLEGEPIYFRIQEDIRYPIATMTKDSKNKGPGSGSGFLLNSLGYIVTNHHVIDNAEEITVKGIGGDFYTAHAVDVIVSDPNVDLAILKPKNPNLKFEQPPYTLRTQQAETGEEVFVMGYPLKSTMGEEVKLTTGVISAKTGYEGSIGQYQVSAPIQPGNSGGPVFDKQGNIIAVAFAHHIKAENASYAIKAAYLQTLLQLAGIKGDGKPENNSLQSLPLSEQVKAINPFVYIIETK